jgi:hypothetical protein
VSEAGINDDKSEQRPSNTTAKNFTAQVNAFKVLCKLINFACRERPSKNNVDRTETDFDD